MTAWSRACSAGAIVLIVAGPASAQRHGRADSAQMYAQSLPAPTLTIEWRAERRKDIWKPANLRALPTTTTSLRLAKQMSPASVVGAKLSDVLSQRGGIDTATVIEVHSGFRHTRVLTLGDFDDTGLIIVDRVDGKPVRSPFLLIGQPRSGAPVSLTRVTRIVIRPSP